jgi:hypothetical protein
LINHYAQGPDLPGGTRHHEIARRLVRRGLDVALIASEFDHATRVQTATGRRPFTVEALDGVKLVRVRSLTSYRGNDIARMFNMAEFALRVRWLGQSDFRGALARADVIVGSSPHLLAASAAEWLSRRMRARFVFEVRDLWPESLVETVEAGWNALVGADPSRIAAGVVRLLHEGLPRGLRSHVTATAMRQSESWRSSRAFLVSQSVEGVTRLTLWRQRAIM